MARFIIKKFLLIALSSCFVMKLSAENLYVTPTGAGAGTGSDWNNAFAGFNSVIWGAASGQLGAGDTLWIAGGTYSSRLDLKGSGTLGSLINIKRARATNAECASTSGWISGFDDQVVINVTDGIRISSSLTNGPGRYVAVDGQTKDGIRVNFTDIPGGRGILIEGYGSFNSTFRNIGSYGPSRSCVNPYNYFHNDVRCLVVKTQSGDATEPFPSDILLEHCTFSGGCAMAFYIYARRVTVQYSEIHTIEAINPSSPVHANLIYVIRSDNCTIRWNNFHDNGAGVGIFFTDFGSGGIQSSNFWIYGNIFRDTNMGSERSIEVRDTAAGTGPLYIYNNTFVHGYGGININAPLNPNIESYIRNNLFVDISPAAPINVPGGADYVTVSNNIITNSYSMFASAGTTNVLPAPYQWQWVRDLHIKVGSPSINAGVSLGSPFNMDPDGRVRGADGGWDVGAYEYGGVSTNPLVFVSPSGLDFGSLTVGSTSNLSLIVQNTGAGTLSGTATVSAPFSIVSGGSYNLGQNQNQTVSVRFNPTLATTANGVVAFTGGGGASIPVSGRGVNVNNQPPAVSAITQSAADVDTSRPGLQVYEGTVVQYSGFTSDPESDPLNWQWLYSVGAGVETIAQSGIANVTPVNFSYGAGSAGKTYVWKLRVSDEIATSESTLSVEVVPTPSASLTFQATNGVISAPFVAANGYISQSVNTENLTDGGRAVYNFMLTNGGSFVVQTMVNAPGEGANSFFVNIDAQPETPSMIWDILTTSGFEQRLINWRGNGTFDKSEFVPKVFRLNAGSHQLIVMGREAGAQLGAISIRQLPSAPSNLRVITP